DRRLARGIDLEDGAVGHDEEAALAPLDAELARALGELVAPHAEALGAPGLLQVRDRVLHPREPRPARRERARLAAQIDHDDRVEALAHLRREGEVIALAHEGELL